MPPTSHPPPTWRRFAATSALLLCLLPTPPPSAAAQMASTPPSGESSSSTLADRLDPPVLSILWDLSIVTFAIIIFLQLLLGVILFYRYVILQTPLPSDNANETLDYGPVGTLVAFAAVGFFFIFIFLFILIGIVHVVIYGLVPPECHTGPPLRHEGQRHRALHGLDPAVIKTFPTIVYSAVKGHKISEGSLECAVCLNDFKDDDTLRLIPKCHHMFHPDCIHKWVASHTTCPICRTDLALQPAGNSASQLAESGTEPLWVEVTVEVAPPDGSTPESSLQEGGRERIQPPDLWDKNESGNFNNRSQIVGSGRIRRFPRSHSTGHSLVRPSEDTERFTLRLPAEVRKQLMDRPAPVLPMEGCSRRGYRCGGEGSSQGRYFRRPDRLDRAANSKRWHINRILPTVVADGGGGSSPGSIQQARLAI